MVENIIIKLKNIKMVKGLFKLHVLLILTMTQSSY